MYTHPIYHWPPKARWNQKPQNGHAWNLFSAYVHFPFCRNICDFCGYETRLISRTPAENFPAVAAKQIEDYSRSADFANASLRSVFFGGGTASLMREKGLASILFALLNLCKISDPEVTLECEPGTIDRTTLRRMRSYGVNRVSVCAQSLDDEQLRAIGRRHTADDSRRLVEDCCEAGIKNVHLDLMYGLPTQSHQVWERTLSEASLLPISHISTYKLYVFKHGALNRDKSVSRPECEAEAETARLRLMSDISTAFLNASGFRQYTLTEFARPECESEYIRSCFDGTDLLPVGPAAFGRAGYQVWENSPYVHLYGSGDSEREFARALRMTTVEGFKRDTILGLWLLTVSLEHLCSRHNVRLGSDLVQLLQDLHDQDLLEFAGDKVSLAQRHRFWAGKAMLRLAEFPLKRWSSPKSPARPRAAQNVVFEPNTFSTSESKLNSIFRMARRDPEFFAALGREPLNTIRNLGYDENEPEMKELIRAVAAATKSTNPPAENKILRVWMAVRREHGRS
jgi:oxygen-independent coproporphyrinogen-3 oxidase